MSIVLSTVAVGHAQADGRRYVTEVHTTDLGEVLRVEYGPIAVIDYQAAAAARAVDIAEQLAAEELERLLSGS